MQRMYKNLRERIFFVLLKGAFHCISYHMFTGVLSLQISIDNPGGTRHGRCRFHRGYCCLDCYFPGVEGVCICVFTLEASLHAMR